MYIFELLFSSMVKYHILKLSFLVNILCKYIHILINISMSRTLKHCIIYAVGWCLNQVIPLIHLICWIFSHQTTWPKKISIHLFYYVNINILFYRIRLVYLFTLTWNNSSWCFACVLMVVESKKILSHLLFDCMIFHNVWGGDFKIVSIYSALSNVASMHDHPV
jgi:hypothetical protein